MPVLVRVLLNYLNLGGACTVLFGVIRVFTTGHTSEENSGTGPITHQNMEFLHIDIGLEFGIRMKIISYADPTAPPFYLSLLWQFRYCFCSTSYF